MTKNEFKELVSEAFGEHFPKISDGARDEFIDTLIDSLTGTEIELDEDVDYEDTDADMRDDEEL